MADPQTPSKYLYTPAHGADPGSWDIPVNLNWNNIDQAFGTYTGLNVNGQSGNVALTVSQAVPLGFILSGTLTANVNYVTPAAAGGFWMVRNPLPANSFNVTFSSASGGNSILIPSGANVIISADGTAQGMAKADAALPAAAGPTTAVQVNNAGLLAGYPGFVYDSAARILSVPNVTVNGNTVLGFNSGSQITVNGVSILMPNGFNINAGQVQMNPAGDVGIGIGPSGGALLTVGGLISSTSGGYAFPDGSTQTSAGAPLGSYTASLVSNVLLNNQSNYFDGPFVVQGNSGTWYASGQVTLSDTSGGAGFNVVLWDGTTVIDSAFAQTIAAVGSSGAYVVVPVSGLIAAPAGNIRISVQDLSSPNGIINFNQSGKSKDSTVTVVRAG